MSGSVGPPDAGRDAMRELGLLEDGDVPDGQHAKVLVFGDGTALVEFQTRAKEGNS